MFELFRLQEAEGLFFGCFFMDLFLIPILASYWKGLLFQPSLEACWNWCKESADI